MYNIHTFYDIMEYWKQKCDQLELSDLTYALFVIFEKKMVESFENICFLSIQRTSVLRCASYIYMK